MPKTLNPIKRYRSMNRYQRQDLKDNVKYFLSLVVIIALIMFLGLKSLETELCNQDKFVQQYKQSINQNK